MLVTFCEELVEFGTFSVSLEISMLKIQIKSKKKDQQK